MKRLLFFLLLLAARSGSSQNIYPEKFDDCHLASFCLDCGDPKAAYPGDLTSYFREKLPADALRKAQGAALVQVLVDSAGRPCVKSQGSNLAPRLLQKLDLRNLLNASGTWRPAQEKGKAVASSVSLRFTFSEAQVTVTYQRFDFSKMSNMRSVGDVEVLNKHQRYPAPPKELAIEAFTTANSAIPWDMMRAVCTDQQRTTWVGTDNGLVKIENGTMTVLNASNSGLLSKANQRVGILCAAVDAHGTKWFSDGYRTYRFDGTTWAHFDSTSSPLRWVITIAPDAKGNVWFGGGHSLVKYDGSRWTEFTAQNSKLAPGVVAGVFIDQQNRVWASTSKGTVRFDGDQATTFSGGTTPLALASFSCAQQASDGTIWFGLYDPDRQGLRNGLAKYTPQGQWEVFTAANSGFPGNNVQSLALDPQHQAVWAGVNRVGLCRFDGQQWVLFTPQNSAVPSTIVEDLFLDADGILWGATYAGLFKLKTR